MILFEQVRCNRQQDPLTHNYSNTSFRRSVFWVRFYLSPRCEIPVYSYINVPNPYVGTTACTQSHLCLLRRFVSVSRWNDGWKMEGMCDKIRNITEMPQNSRHSEWEGA